MTKFEMRLNTDQKDTLHAIYTAANGAGPVRYSAKQLAPTVSKNNAPRYFAALEAAGYLERYQGETGITVWVGLTDEGVRVALGRRRELMPVFSAMMASEQPTEEARRRQMAFLPSTT